MTAFRDMAVMAWFNAAFYGGLLLWTLVFVIVSPAYVLWLRLISKTFFKVAFRTAIHDYGRVCCKLLSALVPLKTANRAGEFPRPCIVVANHQSFFDPYCMGFFPTPNLVFAVRTWPFRIPLYGPCMRKAGYMNTDDLDGDAFLETAGARLREGVIVIIFPEGTRSSSGTLGRFHSGAFTLAVRENVPVIPLCITGTGDVFPKKSRLGKIAPVTVTALEPVYPEAFRDSGPLAGVRLRQHVKTAIQQELETR